MSGLFQPGGRGPVVLPADRPFRRFKGTAAGIAAGVLVSGIAAGALYREFWQDASTDVARLLPASTRAYLAVDHPWRAMEAVLSLDRWHDAEDLRARQETSGVAAPGQSVRLLGVSLESLREVLPAVDEAHLASVPTPEGPTGLLLLAVGEDLARRRFLADLEPLLEPVDRQLGYTIEALEPGGVLLPWGEPTAPLYTTTLDRYFTLAYGPEAGLSDLLQAKVSGRSQSMRRREGFDAAVRPGELVAFIEPHLLYDLAAPPTSQPEAQRAAFVETVRSLEARAGVGPEDEVLDLSAGFAPGAAEALAFALGEGSMGEGSLLALAPSDADLALSLHLEAPGAALAVLEELLTRASDPARPDGALRDLADRLRDLPSAASTGVGPDPLAALAGELVFVALPPLHSEPDAPGRARWVAAALARDPPAAERAAVELLPSVLGPGYAYGTVLTADGPLHLVRPAGESRGSEVLAFRLRGELLEMSPALEDLARLASATRAGTAYGQTELGRRAQTALHPRAAAALFCHPRVLARADQPLVARLGEELSSEFRWTMSLREEPSGLGVRTNLGPWSLLAVLAATDREALDAMLLARLPVACREALAAMCTRYPGSQVCQPLAPGREALAEGACRRLQGR